MLPDTNHIYRQLEVSILQYWIFHSSEPLEFMSSSSDRTRGTKPRDAELVCTICIVYIEISIVKKNQTREIQLKTKVKVKSKSKEQEQGRAKEEQEE